MSEASANLDRVRRLLLALEDPRERDRPPMACELGAMPADGHPALHEWQIEENLQWAREREQRVRAHERRVREHLRRHSADAAMGTTRRGHRHAVWCTELRRRFDSLSAAAEFVGRAASNISQAIRLHVRCGPYHWEHFDPARHAHPIPGPANKPSADVNHGVAVEASPLETPSSSE